MTDPRFAEIEGHRPYLIRYAISQLRDAQLAEEAVQEALLSALRSLVAPDGVAYVPLRDKEAFSTLYLAFRERDRNAHLRGLLSKLRAKPDVPGVKLL